MAEPIAVVMPRVAESMTSATLAAWLKQPGDPVTVGQPIAEVETDKTTVDLEAPADGVLSDIRVAAGTESVEVGTLLATIRPSAQAEARVPAPATAGPGAPVPAAADPGALATTAAPDGAPASTPAPPESSAVGDLGAAPVADPGVPAPTAAPDGAPASPPARTAPRVPATPLAARMAAHAGIDLATLIPTGPDGEVTRHDIDQARSPDSATAAAPAAPPGARTPPSAPPPATASTIPADLPADIPHRDEALTAMRRVTADRMTLAKQTAPHFYLSIDCVVGKLLKRRDRANAALAMNKADGGVRAPMEALTLNDLVVRAVALALAAVPEANVAWSGAGIRRFSRVDLAVAVDTPSGLVTPVVRAADTKSLHAIAADLRDLTDRARDGRLDPDDYTGGTCTVSNLGMFGVTSVTPILNPPQGCILGIGAIEQRPVVRKRKVRAAPVLTVTLAADHRALDGTTGADLLRVLRQLLEEPDPLFVQA